MDWTQLKDFEGIDLNDSFVMGWRLDGTRLLFDLEASIWPASVHYTKPKRDEYTCYRKATLEFVGVKDVFGLKETNATPSTTDPDGSVDYGNIDTLEKTQDGFKLSGDFGSVSILGGELRFVVHT